MLPDPRVEENWESENVLWYLARFKKHRPDAQNPSLEFEFRFLHCIKWVLHEGELAPPYPVVKRDRGFVDAVLRVKLASKQLGKIRIPAFYARNPPHDHVLVEIFDAALPALVKLLTAFPRDHPVIDSYNEFFVDRPEDHRDSQDRIAQWLPAGPSVPSAELIALLVQPTEKLWEARPAAVSNDEWNRRILGVGTTLLQLLAIQHELEEPLNLNGDMFLDLVEEDVTTAHDEVAEAHHAMVLALNLKVLRHRKYWDQAEFSRHLEHFEEHHTAFDRTYRPATYHRIHPRRTRHPAIAVQIPSRVRQRESDEDSDYVEEKPARKRQATTRTLRPRGKDSQNQKKPLPGKVVQSGRGWDIVEVDEE
ncbi:hypothetical protein R3P38DRAFT_3438883 [Favolaschia claudopus]|uniref:Uncharacterized protein n=1 Tax=Favolaschia claudopus TaxID=2862362 RepID=A0AAV9ZQX8_9AGAR